MTFVINRFPANCAYGKPITSEYVFFGGRRTARAERFPRRWSVPVDGIRPKIPAQDALVAHDF